MPRTRRVLAGLSTPVLVLALIVGCGTDAATPDTGPATSADSGRDSERATTKKARSDEDHEPPPAPPRRVIGQKGSKCRLPVKFAIPSDWKPRTFSAEGFDFEQAGYRPVCEIDAKPAGNLGVIRLWLPKAAFLTPSPTPSPTTSPGPTASPTQEADPRQALETFLRAGAGKVEKPRFRPFEAAASEGGPVTGAQVTYVRYLPTVEERKKEAAFAVPTARGMLIVVLSGLDTEEYEEMLPAYVLVKTSIAVTARAEP